MFFDDRTLMKELRQWFRELTDDELGQRDRVAGAADVGRQLQLVQGGQVAQRPRDSCDAQELTLQ